MTPELPPRAKPVAPEGRMLAASIATGLSGGAAGVLYLLVMRRAEDWLGPSAGGAGVHILVMVAVGIAVSLLYRWSGPPGDVELLVDNIHLTGGEGNTRQLRALLPVSLLCIGAGGALGPEAPLVQTTGTIGTWLADRLRFGKSERRALAITGMAAGFTVLFGAPIGGALFALEILHRKGLEYYEALLPALIGSISGYCVSSLTIGLGLKPVWNFPTPGPLRGEDLAWAAALGVAAAGIAAAFTYASVAARALFRPVPAAWRPPLCGAALGLLAVCNPYALGFGEAQLDGALKAASAGALLSAAVAKFAGTTITMAGGWRGGFIIPLFFIGALVGEAVCRVVPGANPAVVMAALMAGINAGVTKTPLGSTLVVSAMTGIRLIPSTLIASTVALVLTNRVALFQSQRSRYAAWAD